MKKILIALLTFLICSCAIQSQPPAPIIAGNVQNKPTQISSPAVNPVKVDASTTPNSDVTSETKISKSNDEDGEVVTTSPAKASSVTNQTTSKAVVAPVAVVADSNSENSAGKSVVIDGVSWTVPTDGVLISKYSVASKGVDVSGVDGQPIIAANDGTVAYSGNGLKGYGNLIIIKHANNYLTAYSHNKTNLVKEGATVKKGQKIALLGKTESNKPMLHFELRKSGKPIDPSSLFPKNTDN